MAGFRLSSSNATGSSGSGAREDPRRKRRRLLVQGVLCGVLAVGFLVAVRRDGEYPEFVGGSGARTLGKEGRDPPPAAKDSAPKEGAKEEAADKLKQSKPRLRPFLYAPHNPNPSTGQYPFHSSDADALEPLQHVSDPHRVIIGAPPPLFLHVYKAGGTNVEQFMKRCFGLKAKHLFRKADAEGLLDSNFEDGQHVLEDADILIGNNALVEATRTGIYTSEPNHRGRAFTMLRHPVEVAVSLYYYLQDADWEPGYRPDLKDIPITEWGTTIDRDNKVIRRLVNKAHGLPLDDKDLHLAKTLLFDHFVVGLTSKMSESLARFDSYFGFSDGVVNGWRRRSKTVEEMKQCKREILQGKKVFNKNKHSKLDKDSEEWKVLEEHHKWDAKLYEYAEELFDLQANLFEFRTVY